MKKKSIFKKATISLLNKMSLNQLNNLVKETGVELVIEGGRITDYN